VFPVYRTFLAFCVFLILTGIKTFPLVLHLRSHLSDWGDPLMLTWVLAWDVHALMRGDLRHFFDANIFYPVEKTLAFSEHLLGILPIFAPVYLLTGNPVLGYNVSLCLSFALSALSMFCLAYYWTRQFWPSLVAGALFGFAPYRYGHLSHLQLQTIFWAPVAFVFLDRFLRTQRWRHLIGFAGFYWFQVLSSIYLGYIVTVGVMLYVGYYMWAIGRGLISRSMLVKVLALVASSLCVLIPVHLAYLTVRESWDFLRGLPEIMFFTPDVLSYLTAPPFMNDLYLSLFRPIEYAHPWEKRLFPGLLLPALVILGSIGRVDSLSLDGQRRLRHVWWGVMLASLVLSLGPYLIVFGAQTHIPLPYLLLYHVVPGFGAMRVPGRFVLLALLAAGPLAALGVVRCSTQVERLCPSWARLAPALTAAGLIVLFLAELGGKAFPNVRAPGDEYERELYTWLNTHRPGPIIELPLGLDDDYRYMYFSTRHWLPLVNGLSSFFPPTYHEIQSALGELPAPKAVEYAAALGVKAIVLHGDNLSSEESRRWADNATAHSGLTRSASFGPHLVYAVPEVPLSPSLEAETSAPAWMPARKLVRLGIIVRPEYGAPWRHPGPQGRSRAVVRWTDSRTGRSTISTVGLRLPPVVNGGAILGVPVESDVAVPDAPGVYTLQVRVPGLGVSGSPQAVEVRNTALPTSRDAPRRLAASYSINQSVEAPMVVAGREPIRLEFSARNTGAGLWLATAEQDRGVVRLGWRWLEDGHESGEQPGRAPINYDVFPGQQYRFVVSIPPPRTRGRYTLELGLVSERVTWFADVGTPPVKLAVEVREPPPIPFATRVQRLRSSQSGAPRFTLSTDAIRRAGEHAQLTVQGKNEHRPWVVDAYLVLEGPRGALWFYDGQRLVVDPTDRWRSLLRSADLPAGAEPRGTIPILLDAMPPGEYTWFLLLTEAGSRRIIADTSARMEVLP
jgi:hypothetical protein